jgi:hypothetical protein
MGPCTSDSVYFLPVFLCVNCRHVFEAYLSCSKWKRLLLALAVLVLVRIPLPMKPTQPCNPWLLTMSYNFYRNQDGYLIHLTILTSNVIILNVSLSNLVIICGASSPKIFLQVMRQLLRLPIVWQTQAVQSYKSRVWQTAQSP